MMRFSLESGSTLCSHFANSSADTSTATATNGLTATAISHDSIFIGQL